MENDTYTACAHLTILKIPSLKIDHNFINVCWEVAEKIYRIVD